MSAVLSIKKTYERHRRENPESILSERCIREAVKKGELPVIHAGSKQLIFDQNFDKWLKGEL